MTRQNGPPGQKGRNAIVMAAVLSGAWLAVAIGIWVVLGQQAAARAGAVVAVAMPAVLIWFAALLARQAASVREEAQRLVANAERLKQAAEAVARPTAQEPARLSTPPKPATPPVAARSSATRPTPREPRQKRLPLEMDEAAEMAPVRELARALDFPESESDVEGFRALRRALADPRTRQLVQATQDILTLLAEEGIYMEDLEPDEVPPVIWRRFAEGDRGPPVARLAAIHDRSSRALTATRMRADPVFRDAAHHFLRLFDRALAQIAPEATDDDLALLSETRTARAFMLVGDTAGTFE